MNFQHIKFCFQEDKLDGLIRTARSHALENLNSIVPKSYNKNDCIQKMEQLTDEFVDDYIKNEPFFKKVPKKEIGIVTLKKELEPQFIEAFVTIFAIKFLIVFGDIFT